METRINIVKWVQLFFGIVSLLFGLNHFLHFMPIPVPAEAGAKLDEALFAAGYFFPIVGGVLILLGLSALSNRYFPLMLVIHFPMSINYVLYHLFLDPANTLVALLMLIFNGFFIWINLDVYKPILRSKK